MLLVPLQAGGYGGNVRFGAGKLTLNIGALGRGCTESGTRGGGLGGKGLEVGIFADAAGPGIQLPHLGIQRLQVEQPKLFGR